MTVGPLISGFLVGAIVLNMAWMFAASAWLSRHGDMVRSHVGAVVTPIAVIAGLLVSLPLGVALGVALPAVTAWWSSEPV